MHIDLLVLLLLSLFLGFRLWDVLGKNSDGTKKGKKTNLFIVPQERVKIEKEARKSDNFYADFDESAFLAGVEKAFSSIQKTLAAGEEQGLSKLVNPRLMPVLKKTLLSPEKKATSFCLLSLTIQERRVAGGVAFVRVQLTYQKNNDGQLETVEAFWTFKRPVASTNPNWVLESLD